MIFKLNSTTRALRTILTLSVGASLLALPAQAQNGFPPGGPGGPQGGFGGPNNQNGQNQNWNSQQRSQMQSQMQNQMLQQSLQRFGLTDTNMLNAILAYANARTAARQPIQDGVRQVMQQMQQGQATDAQAREWMINLQSALNAETTRSKNAERQLDAQIGFSKNAKLQLLLTMMGLIGDSDFLGNSGGRGMGGPGGFGGMQGGFGGPQ